VQRIQECFHGALYRDIGAHTHGGLRSRISGVSARRRQLGSETFATSVVQIRYDDVRSGGSEGAAVTLAQKTQSAGDDGHPPFQREELLARRRHVFLGRV
jgi:hypothetical protein